jgi:predicted metal-dependent phosphoesterase TrpH
MIDLHCHSTASDGCDSPGELIRVAHATGLEALAITDHDTLAGYDEASAAAHAAGLPLICGIELSTRALNEQDPSSRSVHLLGYFFDEPAPAFRRWLDTLRGRRRARNAAMAENLQRLGLDVTLEEAEALGRNITGRPHFVRVMIRKGYVASFEEAFHRYLGEHGKAYVEREDPSTEEGIRRIHEAGGVTSLAHAVRLRKRDAREEERFVAQLADAGLDAIEVWHSDHRAADRDRYRGLAAKYRLATTGGSDYHGSAKPEIRLGHGRPDREVEAPASLLDDLRARAVYQKSRA